MFEKVRISNVLSCVLLKMVAAVDLGRIDPRSAGSQEDRAGVYSESYLGMQTGTQQQELGYQVPGYLETHIRK